MPEEYGQLVWVMLMWIVNKQFLELDTSSFAKYGANEFQDRLKVCVRGLIELIFSLVLIQAIKGAFDNPVIWIICLSIYLLISVCSIWKD